MSAGVGNTKGFLALNFLLQATKMARSSRCEIQSRERIFFPRDGLVHPAGVFAKAGGCCSTSASAQQVQSANFNRESKHYRLPRLLVCFKLFAIGQCI